MKKTKNNKASMNNLTNSNILHLTRHSIKRISQRGIRTPWIDIVVNEGRVIFKQGLRFFYMTDKELKYHKPAIQESLKNLVVVMTTDSNNVITCYKNCHAIKTIKHKNKRLIKN